jgi:uncharacterized protein
MARSHEIDAVRSVALLGICVVNFPVLAQPAASLLAPQTGIDFWVRLGVQTFLEGKLFVLFSFIFGWGFAIQMRSAERAGVSAPRRLLRRLLGLALIGFAHAALVFFGDILVLYALLGLPLLLMREWSPRQLLQIAALAVLAGSAMLILLAVNLNQFTAIAQGVEPGTGYPGSFLDATRQRIRDWPAAFGFIALFNGPLAFAAFCAGLAAAKVDFFRPGNQAYTGVKRTVPALLAVSLPLNVLYALASSDVFGQTPAAALAFACLAVGGPTLGAIYLVCVVEAARSGWLQGRAVAAGRISLTAYVLEGIVAGLIFNGYGLGLYGSVGALGCLVLAVITYAAIHALAALWLGAFRHGPLELVLRWITRGGSPPPADPDRI